MRRLAGILGIVFVVLVGTPVHASDRFAISVEGAYLLLQKDSYQRILSLDRGGTVSQVSNQQPFVGFTSGRGAWKQIGPNRVVAKLVDFNFDLKNGKPVGTSVIVYDLTFSEPVNGLYQRVNGTYSGEVYANGQNPLEPTEPALRTFGIGFAGKRILAD